MRKMLIAFVSIHVMIGWAVHKQAITEAKMTMPKKINNAVVPGTQKDLMAAGIKDSKDYKQSTLCFKRNVKNRVSSIEGTGIVFTIPSLVIRIFERRWFQPLPFFEETED